MPLQQAASCFGVLSPMERPHGPTCPRPSTHEAASDPADVAEASREAACGTAQLVFSTPDLVAAILRHLPTPASSRHGVCDLTPVLAFACVNPTCLFSPWPRAMATERVEMLYCGATKPLLRATLANLHRMASARVHQLELRVESPEAEARATAEAIRAAELAAPRRWRSAHSIEEWYFRACVLFAAAFRTLTLREAIATGELEPMVSGLVHANALANADPIDPAQDEAGASDSCGRLRIGRFVPIGLRALAPPPTAVPAVAATPAANDGGGGEPAYTVAFDDEVLDVELATDVCNKLRIVSGHLCGSAAERTVGLQALSCLACRLLGLFRNVPPQLVGYPEAAADADAEARGAEPRSEDELRATLRFCRGATALHTVLSVFTLCVHAGVADVNRELCMHSAFEAARSGRAAGWAMGTAADALGSFEALACTHRLLLVCMDAFDALRLGAFTGRGGRSVLEPSLYLSGAIDALVLLVTDESAPTGERARAATAIAHDMIHHAQPDVVLSTTMAERAQFDYILRRWERASTWRPGADANRLVNDLRLEWQHWLHTRRDEPWARTDARPLDFCLCGGHLSYWLGRLRLAVEEADAEEEELGDDAGSEDSDDLPPDAPPANAGEPGAGAAVEPGGGVGLDDVA